MKNKIKTYVVTGFLFYLLPVNVVGVTFHEDVLVDGDVTVANPFPELFFDDTDEQPDSEWYLTGNQSYFGLYNFDTSAFLTKFADTADMRLEMTATTFAIKDESLFDIVSVHRNAPLSLNIQSNGDVSLAGGGVFIDESLYYVGIGTTTPLDDLEIQSVSPGILFDDLSVLSTDWYAGNRAADFIFSTEDNGTGGPADTVVMTLDAETGFVGMGAATTPTSPLHLASAAGNAKILVEETNGTQAARSLFEIKNKGNPEFRMTNTGNNNSWVFSAGLRFVIKSTTGARVATINSAGEMRILGSIFTAGGTCGGGCDQLFDPETEVDSIEDHATQMWSNSYLPAVGPTKENAPMNLSEKTGGILNELEKAHIYIEQLHTRNLSLEQRVIELELQNQRIEALEQLVTRLVTNQAEQVAIN